MIYTHVMSIPKSLRSWAFYDFANSAYILIYSSLLLPLYFSTILIKEGYSLGAWGTANAVATIIGVIISILIGKYADSHCRFKSFKWSIVASFLGMLLLAFAVKYLQSSVYYIFILTQSVFILSLSLSDSILPYIATKKEAYEHSGFAWGFGYLGGITALLIAIPLQKFTGDDYSPIVFLSTAIFYAIFSAYSLSGLKKVKMNEPTPEKKSVILTTAQKWVLFIGYWLISEGVTVILLFFTIYLSKELGFTTAKIGVCILLVQLIGFPATWIGGRLSKRYNTLHLLGITILLWGICIMFLVFNTGLIGLGILILTGAMAVGNSQSYLRAQYSNVIDRSESGYRFGLFTIVSEAAVFVGPIIFGFSSDILHSQRIPFIALYVSMVIGYFLVWKVIRRISN